MPENYRPDGSLVEYVVPSLDDPADGPMAFRDFADSIPADLSPVITVHKQQANYTLAVGDMGCIVEMDTSTGNKTVTVPNDTDAKFPIGSVIVIANMGTNRNALATLTPANGVTIKDTSVRKVAYNRMVAIIKVDPNYWLINAGGGSTDTATPTAPKLVSVTAGKLSAIMLWTAPVDDGGAPVTGYLAERSVDKTGWSFAGSRDDAQLELSLQGLEAGAPLWLRVRAVNSRGVSDPSNTISVTPKA